MVRQTNKQTDRQTTVKQNDRQTERQTDREADRKTEADCGIAHWPCELLIRLSKSILSFKVVVRKFEQFCG